MTSFALGYTDAGFVYHTPLADKQADEQLSSIQLKAVTNALLANYKSAEKMNDKQVERLLKKFDINGDGTITSEEVVKSGGDKYDILQLGANQDVKDKISSDIDYYNKIGKVDGIGIGIKQGIFWSISKSFVIRYTNKEDLIGLFSDKKICEYYNSSLWENIDNRSKLHMKELLQHFLTRDEIKNLKFTQEQIEYFTK